MWLVKQNSKTKIHFYRILHIIRYINIITSSIVILRIKTSNNFTINNEILLLYASTSNTFQMDPLTSKERLLNFLYTLYRTQEKPADTKRRSMPSRQTRKAVSSGKQNFLR